MHIFRTPRRINCICYLLAAIWLTGSFIFFRGITNGCCKSSVIGPVAPRQRPRTNSPFLQRQLKGAAAQGKPLPSISTEQERRTPTADNTRQVASSSTNAHDLDIAVCIPWTLRHPPSIVYTVRHLVRFPGLQPDRFEIFVWRSWLARNELKTHQELRELKVRINGASEEYSALKGNVRITHRDPLDQMRWRLRHVLDYANMLEKCAESNARFLLAIEDDLLPAKDAIRKAFDFGKTTLMGDDNKWSHGTLYSGVKRSLPVEDISSKPMKHGNVALLFHRHSISDLVAYLRKEAHEWPPDMLNHRFFTVEKKGRIFERTPNIFQHASAVSTYTGKNSEKRASHKWRSKTFRLNEDRDMSHYGVRAGDKYIGCFHDNASHPMLRDLSGLYYKKGDRLHMAPSVGQCRQFCNEYLYFGVQSGGDCYCGNEFGQHGISAETACNMSCSHDKSPCGSVLYNSVYAV